MDEFKKNIRLPPLSELCKNDNVLIKYSCVTGNVKALKLLFYWGSTQKDASANNYEAYKWASFYTYIEILQLLDKP